MSDERIDALLRQLDVSYDPEPTFVDALHAHLAPLARRAGSRRGGFVRWLASLPIPLARATGLPQRLVWVVLTALLLLTMLGTLLLVGALIRERPLGNGALFVSRAGSLSSIDPTSGSVTALVDGEGRIFQVTRSPDGRFVTFWTSETDTDRLWVIRADGTMRRSLVQELPPVRNACIDVWSPNSQSLASEVTVGGVPRILVTNVNSGVGAFLSPDGVSAHCPLLSPTGDRLAFAHEWPDGRQTLALIRSDGSEFEDLADLGDLRVSGPASWSADGAWVYFDAKTPRTFLGSIYRVNVGTRVVEQLTADSVNAAAPALSPDMASMSYLIVHSSTLYDLYVAGGNGSDPRLVLRRAGNGGWSSDSQFLLSDWRPPAALGTGGLVTVRPDGSDLRVLVPNEPSCASQEPFCLDGMSWGQPRP